MPNPGMPPRPILKALPSPSLTGNSPLPFASSRIPSLDSPHVHFPPTPSMAQMEITHSPFAYDRKPIVVAPNVCAMPARGERKVQGFLEGYSSSSSGGYFQPRASECVEYAAAYDPPPELYQSPEPASSMLFRHDTSIPTSASQPYPYPYPTCQIRPSTAHNINQRDRHPKQRSQPGHVPPPLVFDSASSDSSDSSDLGSPPDPSNHGSVYPPTPMKQKYHTQHTLSGCGPMSMDLSLSFITQTNGETERYNGRSAKRRSIDESSHSSKRTSSTSRTRQVVSAGCTSGFSTLVPGLDGCLGGF
ncbi:unnamed protein product [Cyclocybe aegerita]|uniref:Uncharacterized protein n=1 Tax=Cyclocybe aegerita TaxID=1973307 RepID=A0A8S0XKB8_CYCAE|nr:unnamed protein product [Cyclocybe aegerita]